MKKLSLSIIISAFSLSNLAGQNLLRVNQDGMWGYINLQDELVINPQYQYATDFVDGLAIVRKDGFYYYIDSIGNVLNDQRYIDVSHFQGDIATVMDFEGRYSIDRNFERVQTRTLYDGHGRGLDTNRNDTSYYGPYSIYHDTDHDILMRGDERLIRYQWIKPFIISDSLYVFFAPGQIFYFSDRGYIRRSSHYVSFEQELQSMHFINFPPQVNARIRAAFPELLRYDIDSDSDLFYGFINSDGELTSLSSSNYWFLNWNTNQAISTFKYRKPAIHYDTLPDNELTRRMYGTPGPRSLEEIWSFRGDKLGIMYRNDSVLWLPDSLGNITGWFGNCFLVRVGDDNTKWFPMDSNGNRIGEHYLTLNGISTGYGCTVPLHVARSREAGYWGAPSLPAVGVYFDEETSRHYRLENRFTRNYEHLDALEANAQRLRFQSSPNFENHWKVERNGMILSSYRQEHRIAIQYSRHPIFYNAPSTRNSPFLSIGKDPNLWTYDEYMQVPPSDVQRQNDYYIPRNSDRPIYLHREGYKYANIAYDSLVQVYYDDTWGYILPNGRRLGFRHNDCAFSSIPDEHYATRPDINYNTRQSDRPWAEKIEYQVYPWNLRADTIYLQIDFNVENEKYDLALVNGGESVVNSWLSISLQSFYDGQWRDISGNEEMSIYLEPNRAWELTSFDADLGDIAVDMRFKIKLVLGEQEHILYSDTFDGTALPYHFAPMN